MHRPYRRRWFEDLAHRLFEIWPDLCLGSDVICGFPGEDEEAFAETESLCESVPFAYLHAFPYSRRPGTLAARSKDDVAPQIKKRRVKALRALSSARRRSFAAAHVERSVEVVVEERTEQGSLRGLTRTYVPVWFDGPKSQVGQPVAVRVSHAEGERLFGRTLAS